MMMNGREVVKGYYDGIDTTMQLAENYLYKAIAQNNRKEFKGSILSFNRTYFILTSGFNSCTAMLRFFNPNMEESDLLREIREILSEVLDVLYFEAMDEKHVGEIKGIRGEVLVDKFSYLKFLIEELKTME